MTYQLVLTTIFGILSFAILTYGTLLTYCSFKFHSLERIEQIKRGIGQDHNFSQHDLMDKQLEHDQNKLILLEKHIQLNKERDTLLKSVKDVGELIGAFDGHVAEMTGADLFEEQEGNL